MIVRKIDGQLLVIRQNDHAEQCADFARRWSPDGSGPVADAIIEATRRHDDGWIAWDDAPALDPAIGQPYPFYRMPLDAHLGLFRDGIARAVTVSPEVGLLVSLHGVGLYNGRFGLIEGFPPRYLSDEERPTVEAFYLEQTSLQEQIKEQLRASESPLAGDAAIWWAYRQLQAWDRLSLLMLSGEQSAQRIGQVPWLEADIEMALDPNGRWSATLDPYPFDTSPFVTVVPARFVADLRYETDAEFWNTLRSAPPAELVITLARP